MCNRLLLLFFISFISVDLISQCATNTTSAGSIGGANTYCIATDPVAFTSVAASGGSGTLAYQWEKSSDNNTWADISAATGAQYNSGSISTTTYFRRKSKRTGCTIWGPTTSTLVVTILKANAGPDQGKCSNTSFTMAANAAPTAPAGYTGTWSVISGTATITSINSPTSAVTLTSGTASLKWTISNGTCTKADTVVLTNQTATVALSTPIVSSCINQPLQDIVTVDVNVSWTGSVPGAMINVIHNNKTEVINPATATSPQTIRFLVPADNTSGKTISAVWNTNICTPVSSSSFSVPAACSSDQLNCNILYLCGLDKPYDGDPFDHGLMEYIASVNGGTVSGALTKTDASGYGLYDLNSTTTLLPINLDNYGLIIISPTTEGHIATGLVNALKGWKGSVLNMNYAIMQGLGYSTNNYVSWSNDGYINAVETLLNYDNPTSYMGKLVTLGDYYPTATAYVWKDASSKTANLGGVYFKYAPHTNTQISSTHGSRIYLGYHMNGIWGNPTNGGVLPAPVSSYFAPTKHLTQKGKEILDNALIASATCAQENCTNNIDDDGDGLVDCLDPNCNNLTNGEFDNGTTDWSLYAQPGNTSTLTIEGTNQLSGQNAAKIETTVASGTEWHVQLAQNGKSIIAGEKYKISFRARSSAARNASVAMQLGVSPWTGYFYNTFALTTASQMYSYEFTATATIANNVSLLFNLAAAAGTVWIDQVEFKKACALVEICTNSIDDDADGQIDCLDADCAPINANAGSDISQCMNGAFSLIGNNPLVGQTGLWSIVSGTPIMTAPLTNDSIVVSLPSSQTATLRWTITKGTCNKNDDIVISNTTGCSTVCINPLNSNGDLETEGNATNFNLLFQGTPALLLNNGASPQGWGPLYGSSTPNTTTFQGAYYIKKTGLEGNPHSGTHMIYAGGDFCFTPFYTNINISCGKTYKVSLWAAAYTNGPTQLSSPFDIEFAAGGSSPTTAFKPSISLNAPASTSWNNLNWQRYEMIITIPSGTSFEYANFYFTTTDATRGIVVDDVCITEVSSGSDARAGDDQYECTNSFTLAANTPPAGYTGAWSVVSGTVSLSSTSDPSATATITAGSTATLAWSVTSGGAGCTDIDNVVIGYTNNSLSVNNQNICSGATTTLTATGCTGSLLWSNGATTNTITVAPTATTSYSVTCNPTPSTNLALNGGFESTTNMQDWSSWGGTYGITTVPSEIRTGTKAAKVDGTSNWGGFAQSISAVPGERYTISFWAKSTNTNAEPVLQFQYQNSSGVQLTNWSYLPITSTSYQLYTISSVSPLNSAILEYAFSVGTISILYIDDVTVAKTNACVKIATGTVTVNSTPTITGNTPNSRCGTGTVALNATASAGTLNWYAASSGGASLFTGGSFTTPSISTTTTYYVEATNGGCTSTRTAVVASVNSCGENCTNGIDDDGDGLIDCADTDCVPLTANAGLDQSQCMNSGFLLTGNIPAAGQTGQWSVVSGPAIMTWPFNENKLEVSLPSGQSATLRWILSKSGCSSTDDVIITNTTGCSTTCVDAINTNGDLETEGTATNFNLSFQGTPALVIENNTIPEGWAPLYQGNPTNTATFQGAYYIKKTGAQGNPHSGTHMIYSAGGYCASSFFSTANLSCGKTYKFSAWVAAFTNGPTQLNSPFVMEFSAYSPTLPAYFVKKSLDAPSSTSWNNLNWQRYEMTVTLPSTGNFERANFFFTTTDPTRGILIDDVCITEVSSGSEANAGADQYGCGNVFTLAANTPPSGYTGTWSVVSGSANLSSTTSPSAIATITSGTAATLAWTVTSSGGCTNVDNVVLAYTTNTLSVNNPTICSGSSTSLTATGCTGNLLWSNGSTTSSISISPVTTTSYSVTCTPAPSANLALNGDFESATNLQNWDTPYGVVGITTVPSEVRSGTKAVKIDASSETGLILQTINAVPSEKYTISFYAKATNTNIQPVFKYRFLNSSSGLIENWLEIPITSTTYQLYTITFVTPLNTASLQYIFDINTISTLFVDDVMVTKVNSCVTAASGTVTVNATPTITGTTPNSRCGTGTVILSATASAGTLNWYAASSGGASLFTGGSFTTPSISTTTTYYVDATNGGCTSARTAVVATINSCAENCTNGIDDDGDGAIDCADSDCLMSLCLSNYNFISFGPVNVQHSDIQGKALYCDNVTVSNYSIGSKLPLGSTETVAFVNGNFNMTNGAVQGGKIMATGTVSLTNVTNEAGNLTAPQPTFNQNVAALPMTCSVEESFYNSLSNNLKNMTANGTFTVSGSDKIFNCNNLSGTVVFNLPLSSDPYIFTYGLTYMINHSNVKSIIINITHTDPVFHSLTINESIGLNSNKIIWNFPNATRIRMSAIGWKGTVLAPLANLVMENGHIDGNVITNGFVMNDGSLDHPNGNAGEFHTCYNETNCGISTAYSGTLPNLDYVGCDVHYPTTPILPQSSICVGSTMQLYPNTNVTWTSSNTSVATISNSGLITAIASGNVTFTFSNTSTGCNSNPTANLAILSSEVISITPTSRCGTGTVTLSATTSAGTLNWYSSSTGGASLFTGGSFTTPSISATTTYYVDATNGSCISARTPVIATIIALPTISSSTPNSRCGTGTVLLSATASAGTLNWYAAATGGSSLFTGTSFTTPSISTTTTYYVDATNGGCTSARTAVVATVNPLPGTKIIQSGSRCGPGSVELKVLFGSGNSNWYSASTGGALLGTGNTFNTPSISATTTYYIEGEQNGCISATRQPITATINPTPSLTLNGPSAICINGNTTVAASIAGGIWTSSNPGVATVNASGVITGIDDGTAIITYISAAGCSASNTIAITVDEKTQKTISGDNTLCLGETTDLELNNNSGSGNWGVLNNSIITINQDGEITTVGSGTTLVTYTQANNVCGDTAFYAITVNPIPVITISGPTTICIGDQATSISSNISGGTWVSSNTSVAIISTAGLVTGVASGQATFSYIASGTLCSSLPSTQITVRPAATITITGSPNLCIGSNAVLSSNIAGTWTTNNPSIATIGTTNGVITALSSGSATFNFTSTIGGCVTTAPQQINVADPMTVSINSGSACYVSNMSLSAQVTGGNGPFTYTWSGPSLNSTVGSVTIGSAGTYNLIVESAYGCQESANITISPSLVGAILSADTVCQNTEININTNISGATYQWGGTAQNATDSVVNVIPSYPSTLYTVTVTNGQGCIITLNKTIQVYSKPIISFNGTDTDLCPGMTTSFSANTSGYWYSSNPSVATISNSGIVTAIDSGTVRFIFQNSATNCLSDSSVLITVRTVPSISSNANGSLCVGVSTQITSNVSGSWINNNPTIASISSTGLVTGLAVGLASFDFSASGGCQTSANFQIPVNPKPTVTLTGDSTICIGGTTQFFPATSGSWQSGNVNIATISSSGLVTAVGSGTTRFVYSNINGCVSDSSKTIWISGIPPIIVDGPNSICVGNKTQMTSNAAGQWEGLNNSVAIISSTGEVTGIASGTARFRFRNSLTNCYSNASDNIIILGRPIVNVLGQNILCIGATSALSPNNGGTWTSSNAAVAQVTNSGIVTAMGSGSASFVFTNSLSGCVSNATLPIQVQDMVPVSVSGSDVICIGSTTQLLPDFGGVWESNDETVATVSNLGLVTGKNIGSTTFKFTPTSGCASNNTAPITVGSSPSISINGPSSLCVGDTSLMSPGIGGSWISTNSAVATINNNGKITAMAQGQARFIFTTSSGCVSLASLPIIVNSPPPPPFIPRTSLCIGDTMVLSPNVIGTWVTSNATVATVDNKGKVLALSSGQVRFRYTDDQTGCVSGMSGMVIINEPPVISGESNTLCLGSSMILTPFASGVWIPSDASILGVSVNGNQVTVQGKKSGISTISFTSSVTGCISSNQYPITVGDPANMSFNRPNICIGDTTQINVTNFLGSWSSLTPSIATISPTGVVTAKAKGIASFSFLQSNSTCSHIPSQNLNVLERPFVAVDGSKDICINSTAQLLPTSGGVWTSTNPLIATINNNGLVNGVSAGTAYFRFVENGSGCASDSSTYVNVGEMSPPVYTGPTIVCLGYSGSLIAGVSQSIWSSSDAAIAKISQDGIFTGLAPGKVRFRFTDAANNCQSAFMPSSITIKNCIDPDFNVVGLNYKIYGSVATNDDIPGVSNFQNERGISTGERTTTVRYGQPILDFKPLNSNANLFVEESGAYSFITNMAGKYKYKIPVCINDEMFGCPTMILELTAIDTKSPDPQYISNLDIGTMYGGGTKIFNTLSNDKVLNGNGNASINWSKGSSMSNMVSGTDNMSYGASNQAGKYGMDTMNYSMCWPNPSIANCYASSQFMVVNAPSALNSVVAGDDFVTTPSATQVRFNVLANDMDPENNTITITPQGSEQSMINIPSGRYCVESNGDIVYVPSNGFYGSADIVYNICDNNLVNQECTKATAHILVLEDLRIKMRVYLEGALIGNNGAQSLGTGRPLMRDDLRYSTLNGKRSMPVQSPYKVNPFNPDVIDLPSLYLKVNDESSRNSSIVDSNGVFGVTGENAIVDWVYVQIRSKADNKVVLATRSGLLQRDGDIVDLDGVSDLSFTNVVADSFYIMVKHRNHLGVMSGLVVNGSMVDFTNPNTSVYNYGTSLNNGLDYTGLSMNAEVISGYTALWAGDMNSDGLVKYTAPEDDRNIILSDPLLDPKNSSFTTNYDFTIGYYQGDFNLNAKSKHDNPEDDTNYLFGQVILYKLNNTYLANFGLLVEQVPR